MDSYEKAPGPFEKSIFDSRVNYYYHVTLPQALLFAVLIIVGSFLGSDSSQLTLLGLTGISMAAMSHFILGILRIEIRLFILLAEYVLIGITLLILSVFLQLSPTVSFYLPVTLITGSLVMSPLRTNQKAVLATAAGALALGGTLLHFTLSGGMVFDFTPAMMVFCGAMLLFLWPNAIREAAPRKSGEYVRPASGAAEQFEAPETSTEKENLLLLDRERLAVFSYAYSEWVREIISEASVKFTIVSLLSAGGVVAAAVASGSKDKAFALCWLLISGLNLYQHSELLKSRKLEQIAIKMGGVLLTLLLWFSLLFVFRILSFDACVYTFCAGLLLIGSIPLPTSLLLPISLVGVLAVQIAALASQHVLINMVVGNTILAVSIIGALSNYVHLIGRVAPQVVCAFSHTISTSSLLHVLGWQMAELGLTGKTLAIFGSSRAELIERNQATQLDVDPLYMQGVQSLLQGTKEQVVGKADLPDQYITFFQDTLGGRVQLLFVQKQQAVVGDKEESVLLITPLSFWLKVVSQRKTFRVMVAISAAAQLWLSAARARFASSDVLLATERSVSEREYELNQIIHTVNNIAQDISILCERARGLNDSSDEFSAASRWGRVVNEIDLAVRYLATGVSDVKLLKELMRIKNFERYDSVQLEPLLGDFYGYSQYLAEKYGVNLRWSSQVSSDDSIRVAGREFLETSLRLCIRSAIKRSGNGGRVAFDLTLEDGSCLMRVSDSGSELTESHVDEIIGRTNLNVNQELDYLKAVVNFARLSNGGFRFELPKLGYSLSLVLQLPRERASLKRSLSTGWVLLVDDNHEVTTFYSHIADALELNYRTAGSLAEARQLLEDKGKPALVISDIQLGDGSGLTLVKELRSAHGLAIPIIVVSGNTERNVLDEVKRAGATRHLTKPIGRSKLFSEIRSLMSSEIEG